MNKQKVPTLITALSLIVAAGSIAFGVNAKKQLKESLSGSMTEPAATRPETKKATTVTKAVTQTNDAGELKELLAQKEAELMALKETQPRERREDRPRRESWEDRVARMKEEDPEGYAEMIQSRKERQEQMKYNLAERTATFMDMDTSFMSEEERTNHEQLIERMARIFELTDQFNDPEQQPDRETMGELFSIIRETRPLMEQERSLMFKQLAIDIGYEGEDVPAFSEHIGEILNATSLQMPRGGGRGGRGGR